MTYKYILDGHEPIPCNDLMMWANFMEEKGFLVRRSTIGKVTVSTIFLGLDHAFGTGIPILFETMVFGGPLNNEQERYHTWDAAVRGHYAICKRVRLGNE